MPKDIHFYLLCLVLKWRDVPNDFADITIFRFRFRFRNPVATILGKKLVLNLRINTIRFKNSFINRLVFKYELAM